MATAGGSVLILLLVWYWHHRNHGKKKVSGLGKAPLDRTQRQTVSAASISSDDSDTPQAGKKKQGTEDIDEEMGFGERETLGTESK